MCEVAQPKEGTRRQAEQHAAAGFAPLLQHGGEADHLAVEGGVCGQIVGVQPGDGRAESRGGARSRHHGPVPCQSAKVPAAWMIGRHLAMSASQKRRW